MKKILLALGCWLCTIALYAQGNYNVANGHYAAGEYIDAIVLYEAELQQNKSAQVYYNLGNAYFKNGELAQSILAYERALRLDPRNEDVKHNLQFAQARIVDDIADDTPFFLSQWTIALRDLLRETTWMWMSISLFICCLIGIICFAFLHSLGWRKAGFHTAWVTLVLSIISLSFAGSLHSRDTNKMEAIITQSIVNAKSSPDKSGTDLFVLHEGAKVYVRSTLSGWAEIAVGNYIGWVSLNALERI